MLDSAMGPSLKGDGKSVMLSVSETSLCHTEPFSCHIGPFSRHSEPQGEVSHLESKNNLHHISWKEFKIGELFEISGSKTTPKQQLEDYGKGIYPYITTQTATNGVAGYYDFWTEKGHCLTIDSAVLGTCFYQEHNFSASDHVEVLRPKFKMSKKLALYFVGILNKNAAVLGYSYARKRSQTAIKQEKITLPVYKDGEIAFDFMESFIRELESERVRELESERVRELDAYLKVSGLSDYTLNDNEKEVLKIFNTLDSNKDNWGGQRLIA